MRSQLSSSLNIIFIYDNIQIYFVNILWISHKSLFPRIVSWNYSTLWINMHQNVNWSQRRKTLKTFYKVNTLYATRYHHFRNQRSLCSQHWLNASTRRNDFDDDKQFFRDKLNLMMKKISKSILAHLRSQIFQQIFASMNDVINKLLNITSIFI